MFATLLRPSALFRILGLAVFAGGLSAAAPSVALAQDGQIFRNILGNIGLLPKDREEIEYRERPPLVVPKDTNLLRQPEAPDAHAAGGQWPNDPDVAARKAAEAKKRDPIFGARRTDAIDGARLTNKELAAGRTAPGTSTGEGGVARNDTAGVRMTAAEMQAAHRAGGSGAPTYAPGTEPPRQYLTDPPVGLRVPAAGAPMRRTQDAPVFANDKSEVQAWTRQ